MTNAIDHLEIERKFLLRSLPPGLDGMPSAEILQGYLIHADGREARVRCYDGQWLMTIKEGSGLQRREVEIGITPDQAAALWPLTEGRRIKKTRYTMPFNGHDLLIDVFDAPLAPLSMCEVEFDSEDQAMAFDPPDFIAHEVTDSSEYKNVNLAVHGTPAPTT